MSSKHTFTRDNLDDCLSALAKEYKKRSKKRTPIEIIIVGGASVLLNYGFRESTLDVDAFFQMSTAVKDAAREVANEMGLEYDWLNDDFRFQSKCNMSKLSEHSIHYRTYGNGLVEFRTIADEYLIAMKMCSARLFRNDISDIVGILNEQREKGHPLTMDDIDRAVSELYEDREVIDDDVYQDVGRYCKMDNLDEIYRSIIEKETEDFRMLKAYSKEHPDKINKNNGNEILRTLKQRKKEKPVGDNQDGT